MKKSYPKMVGELCKLMERGGKLNHLQTNVEKKINDYKMFIINFQRKIK